MNAKLMPKKQDQLMGGGGDRGVYLNYDAKIPSAIANSKVIDYGSVDEAEYNQDGTRGGGGGAGGENSDEEKDFLDVKQR